MIAIAVMKVMVMAMVKHTIMIVAVVDAMEIVSCRDTFLTVRSPAYPRVRTSDMIMRKIGNIMLKNTPRVVPMSSVGVNIMMAL